MEPADRRADLRVHGGEVFLHGHGLVTCDILVTDGRVTGLIAPDAPVPAESLLDVSGDLVLPGAIDPHVHLGEDICVPRRPEDVTHETASAVVGGVTTTLVYLMSSEPYSAVFPDARALMDAHSHSDFGFHFVTGSRTHLDELPSYVRDLGVSSFKFFMSFRDDEGAYLGLPGNDDGYLYDLLQAISSTGSMLNVHPENIEIVRKLKGEVRGDGLVAWNDSRPPFVEAEAQQRAAYLASVTGASVYMVHTSSEAALQATAWLRSEYDNIFLETCTHYLTLDTDAPCGQYGKVNPPLRSARDVEALWRAVAAGEIDTVGSDHNARHRRHKEAADIWGASAGFPGTGALLPLVLSDAMARDVDLHRVVDILSTRAAKLFGLYPRKGTIRIGSDADLVVVDRQGTTTITAKAQLSGAAYTPWEGTEVPLRVRHTLVRGRLAVSDGVVSSHASGTYLRRNSSGRSALEQAQERDTPQTGRGAGGEHQAVGIR